MAGRVTQLGFNSLCWGTSQAATAEISSLQENEVSKSRKVLVVFQSSNKIKDCIQDPVSQQVEAVCGSYAWNISPTPLPGLSLHCLQMSD